MFKDNMGALSYVSCHLLVPRSCSARALCTSPCEWAGLQAWRASPVDERRTWNPSSIKEPLQQQQQHLPSTLPASLSEWGALVLNTPDPLAKASITHHAFRLWADGKLPVGVANAPDTPARPPKPVLVPLREVPGVKCSPLPRNVHVLHNLAHIELNAVDLAWDTVVRFSGSIQVLGEQFFADFAHVADDESRHFGWCSQRLAELGFCYGDMPAHNMLVDNGIKSAGSVMDRLVVVPMVQEARGLDSGPRLAARLTGWGDAHSAGIVNQIAKEELAHVAVGVSWFLAVCKKMNKVPDSTFKELMRELNVELKGPFNYIARAKAGLPRNWYDAAPELSTQDGKSRHCGTSTSSDLTSMEEIHIEGENKNHAGQAGTTTIVPSILPETKHFPVQSPSSHLSEVYDRLGLLIAMEKENSA